MGLKTHQLLLDDSGDLTPLTLTARSTPPSNPEEQGVYLDDGTNYCGGAGIPGLRRWTGTAWEDIGDVAGGVSNLDGGKADSNYGGVGLSPLDGGNASSW
jgi:hypothetical protein